MGLTSRGVGVLVLAGVSFALAVFLRLPELMAITCGLCLLLLVSAIAVATRTRIDVTPPTALRVERASTAVLEVILLDHGARALSGMRLRRIGGIGPDVVGLPRLKPGVPATANLPIPTQRRGSFVMGPWSVERVDAWLLMRRVVTRVPPVEVVVVPRVYPVTLGRLPVSDGDVRQSQHQGDTDVASLREYVVGDEVRHIHWRSSAKAGTLMVTQHVAARRPGVHVLLDVAPASYASAEEFEEAVDAAASLAVSAATTGVDVDLTTSAGETARSGRGRHAGVMDLLARVQPQATAGGPTTFDVGHVIAVSGSSTATIPGWQVRTLVRVACDGSTMQGRSVVSIARAADLAAALVER